MELTGALRSGGIRYLSAKESTGKPAPLTTIALVAGGIALLVALALVVIVASRRRKRKERKGTPLPAYLNQWGGKLPYDAAIRVLSPVLHQLADLHRQGICHGDICPENIVIHGANQAKLTAPDDHANKVVLHPHFSSPEHYRADGRIGPWSDVYSICAVLYYMVTASKPAGVLERSVEQDADIGFGNANIDQAQGDVLLAGLSIDADRRLRNAIELVRALGIAMDTQSLAAEAVWSKEEARRKRGGGRGLLLAAGIVVLMLCAGAGFYFYQEYRYNLAVECIDRQDYKGGIDNLSAVIRGFKESGNLMLYACAGDAMQQGYFDQAREIFAGLGDFRNSAEMINETYYQQAHSLLNNGDFAGAKKMFLSIPRYKDSDKMTYEVEYRMGWYLLNKNDFENARETFESLNDYKDSKELILETDYRQAIYLFDDEMYSQAIVLFAELTKENYKDAGFFLIETKYAWALQLLNFNDYSYAYKLLSEIKPYKKAYIILKSYPLNYMPKE